MFHNSIADPEHKLHSSLEGILECCLHTGKLVFKSHHSLDMILDFSTKNFLILLQLTSILGSSLRGYWRCSPSTVRASSNLIIWASRVEGEFHEFTSSRRDSASSTFFRSSYRSFWRVEHLCFITSYFSFQVSLSLEGFPEVRTYPFPAVTRENIKAS